MSEMDLINKIRNSNDPERAMSIAVKIILEHLSQLESSHKQSASDQPEVYESA